MEFDRELAEKIRFLDDQTLKRTILSVAENMGVNTTLVSSYLGDMSGIKEAVSNLTEEDFRRVEQSLGEENTKALVDCIRKEVTDR